MAFQRYRLRSELPDTNKLQAYLNKFAADLADGPDTRIVFEISGLDQFNSHDCSNVLITGTGTTNNIQFRRPGAPAAKAHGALGGLTFQADTAGTAGNAITVAYTTGATAGSEVVTVVGSAISVQIATGVSTQTQVKAALDAFSPAAALIDTTVTSGATAVTAPAGPAAFSGGVTGPALESYDLADIENIRRLRTKKHLIVIKAGSNPA